MSLSEWWRAYKWHRRVTSNLREIDARQVTPRPHGLDAPLIISLTSFPPRFPQLIHTLRCLLAQTVQPDDVILWCAHSDVTELPSEILKLQEDGLRIAPCDDLKSYKKLVPALIENPDRYIATADDDLHYPANWLETLVATSLSHPDRVIAHRAHHIAHTDDGGFRPYRDWTKNIDGAIEGTNIFATGVGGVLYPPHSLHQDVTNSKEFMRLCPTADDIWFYWMARRQGRVVRHVGPKSRVVEWPGSQQFSLRHVNIGENEDNGNDRSVTALLDAFGPLPS